MRIVPFAIFAALLFAADAVQAAEICEGGPPGQWKNADQAKLAAVELGFNHVEKIIIEDHCYAAMTNNNQGKMIGVQFGLVALTLVRAEDPG